MDRVITALDQVTPGWLAGVLRGQGLLPRGDVADVRAEERHASVGGSVVVLYPVWQWSAGIPDVIWWHHLERLLLAFQDLDCAELLA